jgi:hypothetical protein
MRTESLDREGNQAPITWSASPLFRYYSKRAFMIHGVKFICNKIAGIILFAVKGLVSNAQTISGSLHSPGKVLDRNMCARILQFVVRYYSTE